MEDLFLVFSGISTLFSTSNALVWILTYTALGFLFFSHSFNIFFDFFHNHSNWCELMFVCFSKGANDIEHFFLHVFVENLYFFWKKKSLFRSFFCYLTRKLICWFWIFLNSTYSGQFFVRHIACNNFLILFILNICVLGGGSYLHKCWLCYCWGLPLCFDLIFW